MTTRPVTLGQTIIDQFPVYDTDGFSKKSGITVFDINLWKDAIPSLLPVAITEIGTSGEYKVELTPDSPGVWLCEVNIPFNKQAWYGEYTLEKSNIEFSSSMAEDGTTARFTVWGEDEHGRATWLTAMSAKVYDAAGSLVVDLGVGIGPSIDGTFSFSCLVPVLAYNVPYYLAVVASNSIATWDGNCGFVRVE